MNIEQQFVIPKKLEFSETEEGFTVIEINSALCKARIALQGAQLLSWVPTGEQPVVWLSPKAKLIAGKSARGGVPVCWPWFGPHPKDSSFPSHGVARTADWELLDVTEFTDNRIQVTLRLIQNETANALWPYKCSLTLIMTLGTTLEMELITQNLDERKFSITEALHTYFAVSDVRHVEVQGLDGCDYVDKVDGGKRHIQKGNVAFKSETDNVYFNTESECVVTDVGWKRNIRLQKRGSRCTVIWNPWSEKSASMADMPSDGYLNMLCVEAANALDNAVTLEPDEAHRLWMGIGLDK